MTLDVSSLCNAVRLLDEAVELTSNAEWFDAQSQALKNLMLAGVVKNFEFVHGLSIKMIRRHLETVAGDPMETFIRSFRDLLRLAAEDQVISDVEAWFEYRDVRNRTAHMYKYELALEMFTAAPKFLKDAQALLAELTARHAA